MATQIQKLLLDALKKIDRPGTFCTSGCLPPTMPGLEVAGVGAVSLPLGKGQAADLKNQARQAPYGKGTKTLVDTNVRRVWEIDAGQVALVNPQWPNVVDQAVSATQTALGLENQKLAAHLYKLLLYESGGFFLPHRDGEKLERMVATLVIALPSAHEGGQLVVRHEGTEETVDFGPKSRFETQFSAFYADCEHEVEPVTSGFRLALVYNLTLTKEKRTITAPTSREHIAATARILGKWSGARRAESGSNENSAPLKLAVLLDHQYTEAGLTRDALKGVDRARADVLFAAAAEAGCDASLALVTYWVNGSAEPSEDYGYGYGRRGRRRRYNNESEDDSACEHEMGETFDSSLTAEHFLDADGNRLTFGSIPLDENEIVAETSLTDGDPDKEEFEGFTGNAGMTLERWYHRAAIVLWPADARFDVLCKAGTTAAVGGLVQMVRRWERARKSEQDTLRQPCLEFARRIIAHWPEQKVSYRHYGPSDGGTDKSLMLPILGKLEDPALTSAFIRGVLAKDVSINPGKALGDICQRHGWPTFEAALRDLFKGTSPATLVRHAELLADFALRRDNDTQRKALCAHLARAMMSAVERWSPARSKSDWQSPTVNLGELLPPLLKAFVVLVETELLERLVIYLGEHPYEFDLTSVQVPSLLNLESWLTRNVKQPSPPLRRWMTFVRETLESRAAQPPRDPTDWRRESDTGCKCAECQALSRFLRDPNQETLRLPLAEHRRQHLHQVIDGRCLDLTHVTERRGRPYTLVCTKTKASYERALKAHRVDLEHLAKIRGLMQGVNA